MAYRSDTGRLINYEDTGEGFLRIGMRFRKLGDLVYQQKDGTQRVERVTADELYNRKSLRTASLKPITFNHPPTGMVTPSNARELQRGMTGTTIIRDDPYAVIVGVVTDAEMIDAIKSHSMLDVSSGYWTTTVNQDGLLVQSDVKYNHFAGCEQGRAGPDVGFLGLDSLNSFEDKDIAVQLINSDELKENKPIIWVPYNFDSSPKPPSSTTIAMTIAEIKIDDKTTLKVGVSEGEQAIAKYLRDALDSKDELMKKLNEVKADATATLDEQKARADVAEAKLLGMEVKTDEINKAFKQGYERHVLETTSLKFLPPDLKVDGTMPDKDIKLAVINRLLKLSADSSEANRYKSQSDTYIDAAYDLLTSQDSSTGLKVAAIDAKPQPQQDASELARMAYIQRLQNKKSQATTVGGKS